MPPLLPFLATINSGERILKRHVRPFRGRSQRVARMARFAATPSVAAPSEAAADESSDRVVVAVRLRPWISPSDGSFVPAPRSRSVVRTRESTAEVVEQLIKPATRDAGTCYARMAAAARMTSGRRGAVARTEMAAPAAARAHRR